MLHRIKNINHYFAAGVILIFQSLAQVAILTQKPLIYFTGDSGSYLKAANTLITQGHLDKFRTLGYPALIAILGVTDDATIWRLIVAQSILMIIATIEIYWLVSRILSSKWLGMIAAILIGCNLYILNWERCIVSESLAYWGLVTFTCIVYSYLCGPTWKKTVLVALAGILVILIRPIFVILPFVFIAICLIHDIRKNGLHHYRKMITAAAIMMICLFGYMKIVQAQTGYFGLSWVGNANLLGKVLEYKMYELPIGPEWRTYQQNAIAFNQKWHSYDAWGYVIFIHDINVEDEYGEPIGDYARATIMAHPKTFIIDSLQDLIKTDRADPIFYPPFGYLLPSTFQHWGTLSPSLAAQGGSSLGSNAKPHVAWWVSFLELLSRIELKAYLFLPILLVISCIRFWRNHEPVATISFILAMTVLSMIVMVATGAYCEFYRLRFPIDWAMLVLFFVEFTHLLRKINIKIGLPLSNPSK